MSHALTVQRSFLFVADEELATQLDEEFEEDVLVLPRTLDVMQLLEDELILALPLVPKHALCPNPLPEQMPDDFEDLAPNPFAALAALRKPPRPS